MSSNIVYVIILSIIASFILVIACINFMNLSTATSSIRRREIGIRKTYGASATTISLLMSKSFSIRVLIANVIAWPLAWLFFDRWLNNFEYRTSIDWWFFDLAGIISLIIALITVSWKTLKAALANPVDALKHE